MKTDQIIKTHYKVSDFIAWAKASTLVLSPLFQRRSVWPAGAKSYLIDTIVRGLPIPIIFLRERKTNLDTLQAEREVVDGQQRIRTILSFIQPKLIKGFKQDTDAFTIRRAHNKPLAGLPFGELPEAVRQSILDYQFSVHILPSSVDDREVLQIFARMNSTGLKLNDQELRNAAFYGEMKTSMYSISAEQLQRWREWGILTETQISRMLEVEITSEFAQFMISGIVGKTQKAIDTLYKDFDDRWDERSEVERRFRHCMDEIDRTVGSEIAQTVFRNRAGFFALFCVVYGLAFGIASGLTRKKAESLPSSFKALALKTSDAVQQAKAPEQVLESLARRTTQGVTSNGYQLLTLSRQPCLSRQIHCRMHMSRGCAASSRRARRLNICFEVDMSRDMMQHCFTREYSCDLSLRSKVL